MLRMELPDFFANAPFPEWEKNPPKGQVTAEQAKVVFQDPRIQKAVVGVWGKVKDPFTLGLLDMEDFAGGLNVELEHGTAVAAGSVNVTHNNSVATGLIVLAHLEESPLYYPRLDVAELEGDLERDEMRGVDTARVLGKLEAARERLQQMHDKLTKSGYVWP